MDKKYSVRFLFAITGIFFFFCGIEGMKFYSDFTTLLKEYSNNDSALYQATTLHHSVVDFLKPYYVLYFT